jgi:putative photosynthetic complex assembly protein
MDNLQNRMRHRDRDMVPKALVQAMFGLMIASVGIVAYDQWSGRPQEGVLAASPTLRETAIILTGNREGTYVVTAPDGTVLAQSSDRLSGFIGAVGRGIDRQRLQAGVTGNPPVRVVMRQDGLIDIVDDATGNVISLLGNGDDNVAAFAQFVN